MRSLLLASVIGFVALVAAAGCGGNVFVGGGDGGSGGAGSGSGGAGSGGGSGSVSPTGGPQPGSPGYALITGAGELTLRFQSAPLTCLNQSTPSGCGWWEVSITMPAALLVPGTIDLGTTEGADIFIQESANSGPSPDDCSGAAAGGGMLPATLVIYQVADTAVDLEIQGFNTYVSVGKPDGVYTAPLCN
jgi:hypothetical protein